MPGNLSISDSQCLKKSFIRKIFLTTLSLIETIDKVSRTIRDRNHININLGRRNQNHCVCHCLYFVILFIHLKLITKTYFNGGMEKKIHCINLKKHFPHSSKRLKYVKNCCLKDRIRDNLIGNYTLNSYLLSVFCLPQKKPQDIPPLLKGIFKLFGLGL